jgi:hypothetical protein
MREFRDDSQRSSPLARLSRASRAFARAFARIARARVTARVVRVARTS